MNKNILYLFFFFSFFFCLRLQSQTTYMGTSVGEQCVLNAGDAVTFNLNIAAPAGDIVTDGSVSIDFDLYHSWKGDVEIELCAPDGVTCAIIKTEDLGGGNDLGNAAGSNYAGTYTIADGIGGGNLDTNADSAPGSYDPATPFSVFNGIPAAGIWTMTFSDDAGGDDGCIQNVELTLDAEKPSVRFTGTDAAEQCVINAGDQVTYNLTTTASSGSTVTPGSVSIDFEAFHSWKSDVEIILCAPDGVTCATIKTNGAGNDFDLGNGTGSNYQGVYTIADGVGTATLDLAADTPGGSYNPVTSFSVFDGIAANGTWTMTFSDSANQDDGCIQNVVLSFEACDITINSLTPTDESCFQEEDGSIAVSATCASCPNGSADIRYTISPDPNGVSPQTSSTFNDLPPGNYTISVFNVCDDTCDDSDDTTTTIAAASQVTVTTNATNETCDGDNDGQIQYTITSTAPYDFSGDITATNVNSPYTATGLAPNTYNVTITDDNGCTVVASETVSAGINPDLSVTSPVSNVCPALTVDITNTTITGLSDANGTTGTISYHTVNNPTSSTNQTVATPSAVGAGTYYIRKETSAGCVDIVPIVVNFVVCCDITINSLAPTDESCFQEEDGSIVVSATCNSCSASSDIRYSISPDPNGVSPQTSSTFNNLPPNNYTITVFDVNDNTCDDTDNTTIAAADEVMLSASGNSPVCEGSNIELLATFTANGSSTSASSWAWTGPNSYSSTMEDPTPFAASTASTGIYTVTVTDNNNCTNTATVNIVVNEMAMVDLSGVTTELCYKGTETIDLSGNYISGATNAGTWSTSGDGAFDDATNAHPAVTSYSTGVADRSAATVTLTLSADPRNSCPIVSDEITIDIKDVSCTDTNKFSGNN